MATVATTDTGVALQQSWQFPEGRNTYPPSARGEVQFIGTGVIPALLSGNVGSWVLTCGLPVNYTYRLLEVGVRAQSVDAADLSQPESSMLVSIGDYDFQLVNQNWRTVDRSFGYTVAQLQTAFFAPECSISAPILLDSHQEQAPNDLTITWIDSQASATAAITVNWRVRALSWQLDDYYQDTMHDPTLTLPV